MGEGDEVRVERADPRRCQPVAVIEPGAAERVDEQHAEGSEDHLRELHREQAAPARRHQRRHEDGLARRLPGPGVLRQVGEQPGAVPHPALVGAEEALAVEQRLGAQRVALLVEREAGVRGGPQGGGPHGEGDQDYR